MAKKRTIDIKIGKPETPVTVSRERKEFKAYLELLKAQHPVKYEINKVALEAKLKEIR